MNYAFIGQDAVARHVDQDVRRMADCTAAVPNMPLIVRMDEGEGRTSLLRYYASRRDAVRPRLTIDPWLEKALGDGLSELKTLEAEIQSATVFTNVFDGVVGLDAEGLIRHCSDSAYLRELASMVDGLKARAQLIFFLPANARGDKAEKVLGEEICAGFCVRFPHEAYTQQALAQILEQQIRRLDLTREQADFCREYAAHAQYATPGELLRTVYAALYASRRPAETLEA